MPLAGWFRLPALRWSTRIQVAETETLAVLWMSAPSFAHGWNNPSQHEDALDGLVLGGLSDNHR
jgi:hypothetical protein